MRIFIDCTHTATHTYKNTGIHRVVRELTDELIKTSQKHPEIEVIPVMFNGKSMRRIINLYQHKNINAHKHKLFNWLIINKTKLFLTKIEKRIKYLFSIILFALNKFNLNSRYKNSSIEFENNKILPGDIYVIADANWDLPKTYYKFLENLKQNGVVITVICYDIIPIKFPQFCSEKFTQAFIEFYGYYSSLFDQVLCISKNSADDYINAQSTGILSANNPNVIIKNFRLGCDYSNNINSINLDSKNGNRELTYLLTKKYILVVGSLVPHKNIKAVIQSFDLLMNSDHKETYLLFAGNKGWHLETDNLIQNHQMYGNRIYALGSVTDYELDLLYKNCYCLVQASFYEGFGLPVVEALQNCKPVIASNTGSLPEVGGDFCLYFNPTEPGELYEALEKLLDSDIYYTQLVNRIKNEYVVFTWQDCAENFLHNLLN